MGKFKLHFVFAVLIAAFITNANAQDTNKNDFWGKTQDSIFINRDNDTLYVAGSIQREYIPLLAIMAEPFYEELKPDNSANLKLAFLQSGLNFNLHELYQWFAKYFILDWINSKLDNPIISALMSFVFQFLIPEFLGMTDFNYAFFNSTLPNYYYTGNYYTTINSQNYHPVLSTPMPRTGLHQETYTKSDTLLKPVSVSETAPVSDNKVKEKRTGEKKTKVKEKDEDGGFNIFDIIFGNTSDEKNNDNGNKPKTETGNRENTGTKPKTETGNKPNTGTKPKTETPKTETPKTEAPKTETKQKKDNNNSTKPNNNNTEKP